MAQNDGARNGNQLGSVAHRPAIMWQATGAEIVEGTAGGLETVPTSRCFPPKKSLLISRTLLWEGSSKRAGVEPDFDACFRRDSI